ncbi:hypothetical protein AB0H88_36235 [Nonomuraea sp. NPDC050680]|uniref:hypothetical protein n=1 Tax=Nonomuraea sp. NPDC050680 TaxID=3154630 RepID=UPI0033C518E0
MTAKVAPWSDAIEIDTSVSPEQALGRALAAIHARWTTVPSRFRRPELEPG